MIELTFEAFKKIPRLSRDIVITEKIDGTNAQIYIQEMEEADIQPFSDSFSLLVGPGEAYRIWTGSRTRWITPTKDNFGFATWVKKNLEEVVKLGPGQHFGEWWGNGIQRGYGLPNGDKRFSLFNTFKWSETRPSCCHVVPTLYEGPFSETAINDTLKKLRLNGSFAAPFLNPEGIVIYHTQGKCYFKKTLVDDEVSKSSLEKEESK